MIGTGPYDSLREYLEAIEKHGKLIRIDEIDQDAYDGISEGDEINIDISTNEIKNLTKNQTYKMKPFSEIIGKIIAAGGLFKYKPDQD